MTQTHSQQERDGHRIAFNLAFKENGLKNGDQDMFWDGARPHKFTISSVQASSLHFLAEEQGNK